LAALTAAVTLAATPAHAVECSLWGKVPCFPAPPDGKPRYDMPGAAYDPAKLAVERLKAKQAGAAPATAPPPADAAAQQ
jgi:hypothetical protein